MQYQQQGGYFEQQGYGQQPQQQGYAQQGYGGQQAGPRVLLYGAQGVVGHDKHIYGREREDYTELPYIVRSLPSRPPWPLAASTPPPSALQVNVGDETVLSRWNMMQPSSFVSRVQCIVLDGKQGGGSKYTNYAALLACEQTHRIQPSYLGASSKWRPTAPPYPLLLPAHTHTPSSFCDRGGALGRRHALPHSCEQRLFTPLTVNSSRP